MYIASRIVSLSVVLCCFVNASYAQIQVEPRYCHDSIEYEITANPPGGTFEGCGIRENNGRWYFNPVRAATGITVFPTQCVLFYNPPGGGNKIQRPVTIAKPVVIHPPLEDVTTCDGHFSLTATTLYAGAYHYQWTPSGPLNRPDTSITDGYIEPPGTSVTFVIRATDQQFASQNFFCSGSDTVTVTYHPVPDLVVSNDTIINARDRVQLQASGALLYQWFPSRWLNNNVIPNPIASPQEPTTYTVVGTNEFGCTDTAEVFIDINEGLLIPNAFTPNGDGLNDIFRIENIGYQGVSEFRVFNRNGEEVYQTLDGTKGWDGTYKNQPAEAGTYFYIIRLAMRDGEIKVFKGDLTLIR